MHGKVLVLRVAAAAVLLPGAMDVPAISGEPPIPDNSSANVAAPVVPEDANTPVAAANDVDDRRVTAQIRAALASDKSLSPQARNVTIAANPQAVVLRGSVGSAERDRIATLAGQYAGSRQVINQLLVKDR
ncbi:MAG TPA: BON domain-containing protein [Steroidobacteraceae bacterium]|jgi:hypothetical protein